MDKQKQSTKSSGILDLFQGVDEDSMLIKPMTEGLGFKDRVSEGGYTLEVDQGVDVSSDCGTLDIGHKKMDDGKLSVGATGSLNINSVKGVQPILFHSGHDGLIKKTAKKSGESVFGAFVDVLLVLSISIFVMAIVTEFKIYSFNLGSILSFDKVEFGKFLLVFAAFFLNYRVGARAFYGKTLGEWSSRHQLGLLKEQHKFYYPIQVLVREVICILTGIFTLSILSFVFKKDLGFYFSGLHTYIEQKNK